MTTRVGWWKLLMVALAFALAGSVLAEESKSARLDELKALGKAGKYAEAKAGARALLAELEAKGGADSLEAAEVLDLLVELPSPGGKAENSEARALSERAVAIKERALGPDHPDLAVSLSDLGRLLADSGDYAAARPLQERALAIREKALGPDDPAVERSLNNLAMLLEETGDYAAARPLYERALAIAEKAFGPDTAEVARSLNNLANLFLVTGDYAAARPLYERALPIWEKTRGPDHPNVATTLSNLAGLLADTGNYAAARPMYERALAITEKSLGPDHPLAARILNSYAALLWVTGDYAAARPLFERSLAITEKALGPVHPMVASGLNNLGIALDESGDYVAARPLYERALAIWEKALGPDHPNVAACLTGYANLLDHIGDYGPARAMDERALAIREKAYGPDHPEVANSLNSLANRLRDTGDYAAARPLYERAVAIREKALGPDHAAVAETLSNLATLLRNTGDYPAARIMYERAVAIREKALGVDNPDVAPSLSNLAILLEDTGDYAAALPLQERAVAILRKAFGPDHPDVARSLNDLARLQATLGDTTHALDNAIEAERIAREHLQLTGRSLPERQALLYAAVRASGLDLALTLGGRGADGASRRRVLDALVRSRAVVLDEIASRHRAVIGTADPKVAELAETFAASRARLANLVVRGVGDQTPEIYRKLLDDARSESEQAERALAAASAGFARELSRGRLGLDEAAASLPPGSALVAFAQYNDVDLTPEHPTGDVLSYLVFVLRAGERDPRVVKLGTAERIDALVARWKQEASSATKTEAAYRDASVPLREIVWDPLESALADIARVFVVPDGSLNLINVTALPANDGGYLIEHGPLVHYVSAERDLVPSAATRRGDGLLALGGPSYDATSLFASLRKQPIAGAPAVLVASSASPSAQTTPGTIYRGRRSACGDFASVRFDALPATGKETREIASLWKKHGEGQPALRSSSSVGTERAEVLDLRDAAASETALKRAAPGRRVLHLATHGFFLGGECDSALARARGIGGLTAASATAPSKVPAVAGENPLLLSGLALAGANHRSSAGEAEDDGILTAEEIASLDLSSVEWAVLSACETGVGDVRAGEGVFGLRRAFQVAGAGTLIMSLWSVEDESTRKWMKALYEGRLERKLGTAEAVRDASLAVMTQRRKAHQSTHPFYWAAFVAAGDWR